MGTAKELLQIHVMQVSLEQRERRKAPRRLCGSLSSQKGSVNCGRALGLLESCGESTGVRSGPAEPKLRRRLGLEEAGRHCNDLHWILDSVAP